MQDLARKTLHNSYFIIHTSAVPIIRLTTESELTAYDAWVKAHPQGNLWQSLEWKKYQEALGREVRIYGDEVQGTRYKFQGSALVVIDRTSFGLSTWDISRGPLGDSRLKTQELLLETIVNDAKKDRCLSLFLSPSIPLMSCVLRLVSSSRHIQSPATRIIDLTLDEEGILTQMHQKGRYNIKVAQRHGVTIRKGTADDINAFYNLLQSTSQRDVFHISQKSHYARFLTDLESSFFLMAMHDEKPVAGLLGVLWNGTGFYYYGASDHAQRALMAPYLLQWESMKYCKAQGCNNYDLLGIAPPGSGEDHQWGGISGFKEKFGGMVVTYPPEQQIVLQPVMNGLLQIKRKLLG